MKGFFDTSVLVPVFYGNHVHHQASLDLFIQFDKTEGCCGAHGRTEFSVDCAGNTLTMYEGGNLSGHDAAIVQRDHVTVPFHRQIP